MVHSNVIETEDFQSQNHTERILSSKKKNIFSRFTRSNVSDFDVNSAVNPPPPSSKNLKKLLTLKYQKFRGQSNDKKAIENTSMSVKRSNGIRQRLNSSRKRGSYLGNMTSAGKKITKFSKIYSQEDMITLLENFSDLKRFQINSICEWTDTITTENTELKTKLDENFNATKNIIDAFSNF